MRIADTSSHPPLVPEEGGTSRSFGGGVALLATAALAALSAGLLSAGDPGALDEALVEVDGALLVVGDEGDRAGASQLSRPETSRRTSVHEEPEPASTARFRSLPGSPAGEPDRSRDASPRSSPSADGSPSSARWPGGFAVGRSLATGRRPAGGSSARTSNEEPEVEPREYGSLSDYLAAEGEDPAGVRDEASILDGPSNVIAGDGLVTLLAWDPRPEEPRGSYLYVLEQDGEGRVSQVHRYFCPERRLDLLAEACVPIASVYSNRGVPVAVGYHEDGQPEERGADDLDPRRFSRSDGYVEANELLVALQEYFDSLGS